MKKNIASKIITGLAIVIFTIAIIIMVSGTIAIRRNEPVFIFGYALAVVPTESMVGDNPDSLDVNDLVIIKKVDISEIDVSSHQVIVYQGVANNGADILIIHRVVDQSVEGLITQGDNRTTNPYPDQTDDAQAYVTEDNFQGVYVNKITFLKPLANIMTDSRNVIFTIIVLILAIILITELSHILKTIHEKRKETLVKNHETYLEMMKVKKREDIRSEIKKEYMANLEQSRDAKL